MIPRYARMGTLYANQYGRRPTRGIRPWLLIPKLVCVAVFVGSLAAANFIWFTNRWTELDHADPRRLWTVNVIGDIMRLLTVPALLLAIGIGVACSSSTPGHSCASGGFSSSSLVCSF